MTDDVYQGTMKWFGRRWDSPAYEDMPQIPAPVGAECLYCRELVDEEDAGLSIPHVKSRTEVETAYMHAECWLRAAIGSVDHLDGNCTCYVRHAHKGFHDNEPKKSWRDEGRDVMKRIWGENWWNAGRLT